MKNKIIISTSIVVLILSIFILFEKSKFGKEKKLSKSAEVEKTNSGHIELASEIRLDWSIKDFNKELHKIEFCESIDAKYICKIDNEDWFGSDFKMDYPKNKLENLTVKINECYVKLDVSKMFNPNYDGKLNKNQFKLIKQNDIYILYGFFSDGAGTYTTNWKIKDCKSKRSELSQDEKDFEWQNNE
jgi:hypothetical protein